MPNIHHELLIGAPAEKIYNAITSQEGNQPGGHRVQPQNQPSIASPVFHLARNTLKK